MDKRVWAYPLAAVSLAAMGVIIAQQVGVAVGWVSGAPRWMWIVYVVYVCGTLVWGVDMARILSRQGGGSE